MTAPDPPPPVDPAPMSRRATIVYAVTLPLALLALVFGPAGRLDWWPGWVFVVFMAAGYGVSAAVLARVNPVIFRARSGFQPGTERWDLWLLAVLLPAMVAEIPLASLDAGRMGWSMVPAAVVVAGYALLAASMVITAWAQAVNRFFEPGVRLQRERGQYVVTAGPYAVVRHPGYAGALMLFAGMPLALGSWWALVPAAVAAALLLVRTGREDALLRRGLAGYADYARRVRFRLVPGVW